MSESREGKTWTAAAEAVAQVSQRVVNESEE